MALPFRIGAIRGGGSSFPEGVTLMRQISILVVVAMLALPAFAQQPNQGNASQTVNGQQGPPFPILNVPVPLGVPSTGTLSGLPNAPFMTFIANDVAQSGTQVLGNQVFDLDLTTQILLDGTTNPAFTLDSTGTFAFGFQADPPSTLGSTLGVQSGLVVPSAPAGALLTAASQLVISAGITSTFLTLGDDSTQNISLANYPFQLPFYGVNHNSFWVSANGYVSFGSANSDFTSSPSEMLGQMPRIAMMWLDLAPQNGGTIEVQIDESTPIQVVRVIFTNVREFGVGPSHTFNMNIDVLGNINLVSTPFNPAPPQFTCMTGISPGGNLSTVTAQQDIYPGLASAPLAGAANQACFEWFGLTSATYYTLPTSNPYDLTGRTMAATYIGGSQYFVTSF